MINEDNLPEKKIKRILEKYLVSHGWECNGDQVIKRCIDIEASRGTEKWVIEIKSAEALPPDIILTFVSVVGKALQRMDDPNCKYSIALPDIKPFRRLWERFPTLAKERTGITSLFVGPTGAVDEITG
jgi:hypothetical protein